MRFERYDLAVVQGGTGVGTVFNCSELSDKWIQVNGIAGGCTLTIEGTIDGTNYVTSAGPGTISADGIYAVEEAFLNFRVNRTAQGSGNPTVKLAGRNGHAV